MANTANTKPSEVDKVHDSNTPSHGAGAITSKVATKPLIGTLVPVVDSLQSDLESLTVKKLSAPSRQQHKVAPPPVQSKPEAVPVFETPDASALKLAASEGLLPRAANSNTMISARNQARIIPVITRPTVTSNLASTLNAICNSPADTTLEVQQQGTAGQGADGQVTRAGTAIEHDDNGGPSVISGGDTGIINTGIDKLDAGKVVVGSMGAGGRGGNSMGGSALHHPARAVRDSAQVQSRGAHPATPAFFNKPTSIRSVMPTICDDDHSDYSEESSYESDGPADDA